jgi:hypothetical protein
MIVVMWASWMASESESCTSCVEQHVGHARWLAVLAESSCTTHGYMYTDTQARHIGMCGVHMAELQHSIPLG